MTQPITPGRLRLPPETIAKLSTMEADVKAAQHDIDVLKSLKIDTKLLEEKLGYIRTVRETLLREFSA